MGFPICSNFIFKTVLHKHSQVGFLWFDFFCSDILCLINPGMLNPIPRNENMTVLHAPEQVERVGFFRFLPGSFCGSVRPPSWELGQRYLRVGWRENYMVLRPKALFSATCRLQSTNIYIKLSFYMAVCTSGCCRLLASKAIVAMCKKLPYIHLLIFTKDWCQNPVRYSSSLHNVKQNFHRTSANPPVYFEAHVDYL